MKTTLVCAICMAMISQIHAQHERTEHWYQRYSQFKNEFDSSLIGQTILLGNSITEGFDIAGFFPNTKILNRGISGDHIDGLIERLDFSVIHLKPSRLFILIGINDIGAGDSDSTILSHFDQLLEALSRELPGTTVYIQSILPTRPDWSNCPREQIIRINRHMEERGKEYQYNWIDLYEYFVDSDGYLKPEFTSDGLHLNTAGYQQWYEVLKSYNPG
jgi:lysophospholipase L1-like esterase